MNATVTVHCTDLYDISNVLLTMECHEVHGKLLELVSPVVKGIQSLH